MGHYVLLGVYSNEDIYSSRMTRLMDSLSLNDAAESLHGNKCPSTTTKSLTAKPFDILMCSIEITPVTADIDFMVGSS